METWENLTFYASKIFYLSYNFYIIISGKNFIETALDSWVTIALKHSKWHLRGSSKNYVDSDAFRVCYTERDLRLLNWTFWVFCPKMKFSLQNDSKLSIMK